MNSTVKSRKAGAAYTIVTAFLILAVVGMAAQVGTRVYRALSAVDSLEVPAAIAPENLDIEGIPDRVEIPTSIDVQVDIPDPSAGQLAMALLMDLGPWLLGLPALLLLRALAGSIRDGEPFGGANVSRLRKLGFVLLAYPLVQLVSSVLLGGILDTASVPDSVGQAATLHLTGAVAGLGVLVLAEVFAEGVRLRQDVEGTV